MVIFANPLMATPNFSKGLQDCPGEESIGVVAVIGGSYRPVRTGEIPTHCWIRNIRDKAGRKIYAFSANHSGNGITMADPSILRVKQRFGPDLYFAVGTSDEFWGENIDLESMGSVANFMIYKSYDLVTWIPHKTVFDDSFRVRSHPKDPSQFYKGGRIQINGREFCHLWAPQIYRDPEVEDAVFISFTATESRSNRYCEFGLRSSDQLIARSVDLVSTFLVSSSWSDFLNPEKHFASSPDEPNWYAYRNPSTGRLDADGGSAVGVSIPTTGTGDQYFLGAAGPSGPSFKLCFLTGCAPWMGLDTFLFRDPKTSKRWALWTWFDSNPLNADWIGNHIAGAPLTAGKAKENQFLFDVTRAATEFLPFAYRKNVNHSLTFRDALKNFSEVTVDNGCSTSVFTTDPENPKLGDQNYIAQMADGRCIAEAPSLYYREGPESAYYFLYSRNAMNAPNYEFVYRKASSLEGLAIEWFSPHSQERLLTNLGTKRSAMNGSSFGHGEIFKGPDDREYLLGHQRDGVSGSRTGFLKEISFDEQNDIISLNNAFSNDEFASDRMTNKDLGGYVLSKDFLNRFELHTFDGDDFEWYSHLAPDKPQIRRYFNDVTNPENGFVHDSDELVSGGRYSEQMIRGFLAHPPFRGGSFIKGYLRPMSLKFDHDYLFLANIGLGRDNECGNGVSVELVATDVASGAWQVVERIEVPRFSGKKTFVADLKAFKGKNTELALQVNAQENPDCDHLHFENVNIFEIKSGSKKIDFGSISPLPEDLVGPPALTPAPPEGRLPIPIIAQRGGLVVDE